MPLSRRPQSPNPSGEGGGISVQRQYRGEFESQGRHRPLLRANTAHPATLNGSPASDNLWQRCADVDGALQLDGAVASPAAGTCSPTATGATGAQAARLPCADTRALELALAWITPVGRAIGEEQPRRDARVETRISARAGMRGAVDTEQRDVDVAPAA